MIECTKARELITAKALAPLGQVDDGLLNAHLATCQDCTRLARATAAVVAGLEGLAGAGISPRPEVRARVLAALPVQRPASRRSVRKVASSRRQRRPAFGYGAQMAVAAVLVIAAGFWFFGLHRDTPTVPAEVPERPVVAGPAVGGPDLPTLDRCDDHCQIVRSGRSLDVSAGMRLVAGDRLMTAGRGRAGLRYRDGSSVALNGGSTVTIEVSMAGKRLTLERGEVFVDAAGQPVGRPMVLNPDREDQVTVLGTAFELTRGENRTELRMLHGRVAFGRDRAVEVGGGQGSAIHGPAGPEPPTTCPAEEVAAWRSAPSSAEVSAPTPEPPPVAAGTAGGPAQQPARHPGLEPALPAGRENPAHEDGPPVAVGPGKGHDDADKGPADQANNAKIEGKKDEGQKDKPEDKGVKPPDPPKEDKKPDDDGSKKPPAGNKPPAQPQPAAPVKPAKPPKPVKTK
ncbi:MAG TPA: FecR domain-containing protein [Planctomycetota bacterium]|nr:FecR domain-containing protein [Planctomycetota bacterium]